MRMYYTYVETPVGTMLFTGDKDSISGMYWKVFKYSPIPGPEWIEDRTVFADAITQIEEYFKGERKEFDLVLSPKGTPFQLSVWRELEKVSYGTDSSYQAIASTIGNPKAVRAVGTAVGRNPISIALPCHRILRTNRHLGGYAGGLHAKQHMLVLEKIDFRAVSTL